MKGFVEFYVELLTEAYGRSVRLPEGFGRPRGLMS